MDDYSDETESTLSSAKDTLPGILGKLTPARPGEKEDLGQPTESGIIDFTAEERNFEDLTLAELLGQFLRAPWATMRALTEVSSQAPEARSVDERSVTVSVRLRHRRQYAREQWHSLRHWIQLGLQITAFLIAVRGCYIWAVDDMVRPKDSQLYAGLPYVLAGIFLWLYAEGLGDWQRISKWWQRMGRGGPTDNIPGDSVSERGISVGNRNSGFVWASIDRLRLLAALGACVLAYITWANTADNRFNFLGWWSWFWCIVLMLVAVAPESWNLASLRLTLRQFRASFRLQGNWTLIAILTIMLLGAYFRLHDLDGMPPQMTSDHKEKLLDAQAVLEGEHQVFFPNNGGREGFQMYALALMAHLPGFSIDHFSLKVLAVVESLITLPVLWWLGREIIGERDRHLGNVVGLVLMALVAVSYWHVAITRLALRIVLTPLFAALLLIFLSRAMRHNRRGDYILTGLVLGFGFYTYQAARMLPLVVVAGIGVMLLRHVRQGKVFWGYLGHLGLLVLVSFVVFIPLFRFSQDNPEIFWMRANGRILGTPVIEEVDSSGVVLMRDATLGERFDAFKENMTILADNIRRALLMYNWQGDEAWFHGIPHHPIMDIFTGGLLIIGVGAWIGLMVRHRDPVHLLIPIMVFIMLLPSALSIGRPTENPSATRSSGSLPPVYLIAAFPLALTTRRIKKVLATKSTSLLVSVGVTGVVVVGAYATNTDLYFDEYREVYRYRTWPYSEPGQMLRGFAISDGDFGNAFMISYSYWWDYTIVGMEAGILDWPNGIDTGLYAVEDFVRDAFACAGRDYPLDPDKDILFFYHYEDDEAENDLREWFPEGYATLIESYYEDYNYKIFRVPALGIGGLRAFVRDHTDPPNCTPREF